MNQAISALEAFGAAPRIEASACIDIPFTRQGRCGVFNAVRIIYFKLSGAELGFFFLHSMDQAGCSRFFKCHLRISFFYWPNETAFKLRSRLLHKVPVFVNCRCANYLETPCHNRLQIFDLVPS